MKTTTKEIVIAKAAENVITKISKLSITTPLQMSEAAEMLSILNKELGILTKDRETITKPMNEALKEVRGRYKPKETMLENAIVLIRNAMRTYQTEAIRLAKAEEAKIAERVGEGKGNFKAETAIRKIDEIERAPEKVMTDSGMVKFRTDKKLKITNEALIPREYLIINESALLTALKAGKVVSGAEIEEVQTPINFR